ncbi:hypothetical protein CsSME_00001452 [Camellia sinensis var. sinensis]
MLKISTPKKRMLKRSRLKGLVAELVKLKDSLTTTALEKAILNFQVGIGNAEVALSWSVLKQLSTSGLADYGPGRANLITSLLAPVIVLS